MVATPNEPDVRGRIGRTYRDSTPSWPAPPAGLGGPNVAMIVLDDTGFAHLGCYGSELATPSIDRLAGGGLRYTGFHTTALCSPSRAALLTGRNAHAVGMRGVSNWNTGFPHMRGGITPRAATVAELLRAHGYATYAAGKWHLAPMEETSAAGPHTNWPLQKGFDRFYGFLQAETDQFYPELTSDNGHIDPPGRPEDGYHVSEDIVTRATGWISDLQSVRPDRPFFLYLAFGATHAPYYPPIAHLPADASPRLGGRPWLIAADVVVPAQGAEGVLYARGSRNAGHSFFISDGALHFDYNTLGTHYRATAPLTLPSGRHQLLARFDRAGPGGTVTIGADGVDLASVHIPTVMRIIGSTGVDIGRDALSPVADDYEAPFPFNGLIEKITFRIGGQADIADVAATARTELARE